jgi:pimeloyl-ACP methyl ester carboxylesterase
MVVLAAASAAVAQQEKSVTIFGAKINYIEAGDPAKPVVILLHGLGGSTANWMFTTPAIAANFHVFVPDQVGFGKSDKPAIKYRVGTYVDFLDKFMSELKIEHATLVGNSLGGWVAALTAIKYPNRVDKLVLADAAGIKPTAVDISQIYALNYSTRDELRLLAPLVFYNTALFATDAAIDQGMTARLTAGDGNTIDSLIQSIRRDEDFLNGRMGSIKKPTLIVWGKQDGLIKLADGEQMNREITGSEIVVFDKCGHIPQIEKAVDFNKTLLAFLAK